LVALVVGLCASVVDLVALVVELCASVAMVVELIAVVVGLFSGVAIGFDGIDRANVVARIDFGAFSTHVVGRLEDLQLLRNFRGHIICSNH